MTLMKNIANWLIVCLAMLLGTISGGTVAGILSYGCCGVLMCTASSEKNTLEDRQGLKSSYGQPIIGTYLNGPLRQDAERRRDLVKD
jgi:hypothetical protein